MTSACYNTGASDDLFKFDSATMEWTKLDSEAGVTGTKPGPMISHSMTAMGTDIYIVGSIASSSGEVQRHR